METAFEQMEHDQIHKAMYERGIKAHIIAILVRELDNARLTMEVPTAGEKQRMGSTKPDSKEEC